MLFFYSPFWWFEFTFCVWLIREIGLELLRPLPRSLEEIWGMEDRETRRKRVLAVPEGDRRGPHFFFPSFMVIP